MNCHLPIMTPPPPPSPTVRLDVRYVVFNRSGTQMKVFSDWFDRSYKLWSNVHMPNEYGGELYVTVDPVTAMSVFRLTPEDMGFSEAEIAFLNLIKKGS